MSYTAKLKYIKLKLRDYFTWVDRDLIVYISM